MWLYTSKAWQPHRSVASKYGDFRYHGPKYKLLDVASGIAFTSPLTALPFTAHLPSCRRREGWLKLPMAVLPRSLPGPESLFNLIDNASGLRHRSRSGRPGSGHRHRVRPAQCGPDGQITRYHLDGNTYAVANAYIGD